MSILDLELDSETAKAEADYLDRMSADSIGSMFEAPEEFDAEHTASLIKKEYIFPHFKDFLWNEKEQKAYMVLAGAAGTGKSKAMVQRFAYLFLTCKNTEFAVVRASSPNLVRSVYLGSPSIVEQLALWGVPISKWLNKTERRIVNPENGNIMYFIGLDDPEKIKSMNINYVWMEEATELTKDKFNQIQTRNRRPNPNKGRFNQMFLTFNPISIYNWAIELFITHPSEEIRENSSISHTNIKQNRLLTPKYIKTIYDIASRDYAYYMTYVRGRPGIPTGLIYTNFRFQDRAEWPEGVYESAPYYGIDWGINDPTVLVECRDYPIYENGIKRIAVYCRLRYYERDKRSKDLIDFLNEKKISRSAPLYCDHNMKEGNMNLQQEGYNAQIAMKNIFAGISYLKGLEIIVDSTDPMSEEFRKELTNYVWEPDKEDSTRLTDKPKGGNEHVCDATRYSIFSHHMLNKEVSAHTLSLGTLNTPTNHSINRPSSEGVGVEHVSANYYANNPYTLSTKFDNSF